MSHAIARLPAGAAVLGVLFALLAGPSPSGGQDAADHVYVAIQGDAAVAVIDAATLDEIARIDLTELGFSENAKPHHIAVDPDGSHWYVSLIGDNRVLRFDRQNELVGQVEMEVPGLLVRDPGSARLYVGRSMSAVNPPQSVGMIDVAEMSGARLLDTFFPRPHALAIAPGAGLLYSASLAQNQMASLDPETEALELLNLDGPVHTLVQFAVSPDESVLVGTTEMTGQLFVWGLDDPVVPELIATIPVGSRPWHPVFEPGSNTRVWFALKGDNQVVGVDLEQGEVMARISHDALVAPHGAVISPDGRFLFISSNGPGGMDMSGGMSHETHEAGAASPEAPAVETGTLTVVDLASHEVVRVLEMGENTTGIGTRQP